jgi:hypothetical protein
MMEAVIVSAVRTPVRPGVYPGRRGIGNRGHIGTNLMDAGSHLVPTLEHGNQVTDCGIEPTREYL